MKKFFWVVLIYFLFMPGKVSAKNDLPSYWVGYFIDIQDSDPFWQGDLIKNGLTYNHSNYKKIYENTLQTFQETIGKEHFLDFSSEIYMPAILFLMNKDRPEKEYYKDKIQEAFNLMKFIKKKHGVGFGIYLFKLKIKGASSPIVYTIEILISRPGQLSPTLLVHNDLGYFKGENIVKEITTLLNFYIERTSLMFYGKQE